MKLIFDLDETLIDTTQLNNDAYNFALEAHGFKNMKPKGRLTRKNLFFLPHPVLNKVIDSKQKYFMQAWLPYRIFRNESLLTLADKAGKENCILWTRAEERRVKAILDSCNMGRYFCQIVYDDKTSFHASVTKLKETARDDLLIFEDDHLFFKYSSAAKLFDIKSQRFHFAAYFIS